MRCPTCGHPDSKVVDSRPSTDGAEIRRRRECEHCEERFTTYERVVESTPVVVKRDGRREMFDPEKVLRALRVACRKRPIPAEAQEGVVRRIERRLASGERREVPSQEIGRALLLELQGLDPVAWARFASVYLNFESLEDFRALTAQALARSGEPGEPDAGGSK
jgi:transcriptional repressor NrdR